MHYLIGLDNMRNLFIIQYKHTRQYAVCIPLYMHSHLSLSQIGPKQYTEHCILECTCIPRNSILMQFRAHIDSFWSSAGRLSHQPAGPSLGVLLDGVRAVAVRDGTCGGGDVRDVRRTCTSSESWPLRTHPRPAPASPGRHDGRRSPAAAALPTLGCCGLTAHHRYVCFTLLIRTDYTLVLYILYCSRMRLMLTNV